MIDDGWIILPSDPRSDMTLVGKLVSRVLELEGPSD